HLEATQRVLTASEDINPVSRAPGLEPPMDKQDWALVTLAHPGPDGKPVRGLDQLRLMKSLFLVQQKFPRAPGLDFRFEPYLYGPFTPEPYHLAEALASQQL